MEKASKQLVYAVIENIENGSQVAQFETKFQVQNNGYPVAKQGLSLKHLVMLKNSDVIIKNIVGINENYIVEVVDISDVE